MRKLRNLFAFIIAAGFAIALSGCQQQIAQPVSTAYRPLSPHQQSLLSEIKRAGAQVIRQGDIVRIILPTDTFFKLQTTNLHETKVRAVKQVARFVRSFISAYPNPRVLVLGYTDNVFKRKTRKQLSLEYARVIASYLWGFGVPRKYVTVRGMGDTGRIASGRTVAGRGYNRRVEVIVRWRR